MTLHAVQYFCMHTYQRNLNLLKSLKFDHNVGMIGSNYEAGTQLAIYNVEYEIIYLTLNFFYITMERRSVLSPVIITSFHVTALSACFLHSFRTMKNF